jgi:predicted RNA binding protein with dsRBD fold (UPF0201 family)
MDVDVTAEAIINPTEDEEKVERALRNIFPSGSIQKTTGREGTPLLVVHGNGLNTLSTLRNLIRQERIRGAARRILLSNLRGQRIRIHLHKQAAYVGRVSFCEPEGESPHGPISIEIQSQNPEMVIDFLASTPPAEFSGALSDRRKR